MSRNKIEAAEKSLRFYKSCTSSKEDNERFETEKAKLHSTVKANEERGEKLVWADFSKSTTTTVLWTLLTLIFLQHFYSHQRSSSRNIQRTLCGSFEHILWISGVIELCVDFVQRFRI